MKIKANNANSPIWKDVYSHSKLPQQLEPLNEIATNLWWVWNHEGAKLFGKIDKQLWKSTEGNPVQLLQSLSHKRMEEILADKELMAENQKGIREFQSLYQCKTRQDTTVCSLLQHGVRFDQCIKDLLRWSGSISR